MEETMVRAKDYVKLEKENKALKEEVEGLRGIKERVEGIKSASNIRADHVTYDIMRTILQDKGDK